MEDKSEIRSTKLASARLRRALEVLEVIHAARDLDAFVASVGGAVHKLVAAHNVMLAEANLRRGRST
jgi:hypothetical protein